MQSCAVIVLSFAEYIPETDADYFGADRGSLLLAEKGIRMKAAVGDFDSVNEDDMKKIAAFAEETVRLNPVKDDSDSEAAVRFVMGRGYDRIVLAGALGGRADHSIVNLRLAMRWPGILELIDAQNRITACSEGVHVFEKGQYDYISFFAQSEAEISLSGMKYPLRERTITSEDLYTLSNEILEEQGILQVHRGTVLAIQSRDK